LSSTRNELKKLLAYHISWGTYGTRLHGDPRGTVHRSHNEFGTPVLGYDEHRWEAEKANLKFPPVRLDRAKMIVVEELVPEICKRGHGPAKHVMVEFATQGWTPGERFHLEVSLISENSELLVHARAWGTLKKSNGTEVTTNCPACSLAGDRDQQGFPCNVLAVGLRR
jgi:hypothetical protein